MKFLRTLFAGLMTSAAAHTAQPPPENPAKSPADMMREMRTRWLTLVPEKGSYQSEDEVIAVVMDWPLDDNTITVLSSSGGDASLYTTGTFGIMGGIGHEKVRKAAIAFTACAQRFLKLTTPTNEFPYPDRQTLRFYMVTPSGVRTVSFPLAEIDQHDSPARALYGAGHDVVTELRLTTPQK